MTVGLSLVWWTDVGQARFPRITVVSRQFLTIPVDSATTERVFSFAGLTLSELHNLFLKVRWSPSCGPNGGLTVFLLVEVIFS